MLPDSVLAVLRLRMISFVTQSDDLVLKHATLTDLFLVLVNATPDSFSRPGFDALCLLVQLKLFLAVCNLDACR